MEPAMIPELFASVVERHPDHEAIICEGKVILYNQLDYEANKLANFLIESGASKGSIVASFVRDPIQAITSVIGILKAGCVIAPFDPGFDVKMLELLTDEVRPQWFVTESALLERIRELECFHASSTKVICLDGGEEEPNCLKGYKDYSNSAKPAVSHHPDDLCYICFTSGATGQPRAVAAPLKAIDHYVRWEIETLGIAEGMRVSQLLPLSFDGSLRDIFVALCAGATVCVPDRHRSLFDGPQLGYWVRQEQIEVLHCTPTLLRMLLRDEFKGEGFEALKYVLTTGEPLLPGDVARWVKAFGEWVQLVNLYGMAEMVIAKFFYFVQPSDKALYSIPIGKPIRGARALAVGEDGAPCPPKVPGEIYIRTPYRSFGYYNRPEVTGDVFIQNPFSDDPTDIVYKTGDLGRVLEDGNYEYLGRKNGQIGLRGMQTDPGEIEDLLRSHDSVRDAAVVQREDSDGRKYLCAYVVPKAELRQDELRQHMADYLPQHMLPWHVMVLDRLPLTFTGRVNARALPEPDASHALGRNC